MYDKVSTNFEFVNREKKVLDFWNENHIFEKSIDSRKNAETFTFYDGPPTANGKPHIGHVLTRVIKDMIPRYKTMKGYMVPRKAGWDTHGLPVEIEVEKLLGIEGKQGIEEYGLEPFIKKCKESVWKYKGMWEDFSGKVGFWADMDKPYVTYDNTFIESEWWALKQIWDKGLLYKGFKIVPYCPRCGTPLSSQEVAQGYKDVKERSAVVKFKAKGEEAYFLAWTTTPWTLPSNVALCVNPAEDYVKIKVEDGTVYYMAQALVEKFFPEGVETLATFKGKELEYREYEPLFECTKSKDGKKGWYVTCDGYVTLTDGTGIVHIAPAFGEDDANVGKNYDLPFVQLVDAAGCMDKSTPWAGKFCKDADKDVLVDLDKRGLLFSAPVFEHEWARRAGLGWIGRNSLLIHPRLGSYCFIGVIISDFEPSRYSLPEERNFCGQCNRCVEACPTGALSSHEVNANLCIAYNTIERKDDIPSKMKKKMGDRFFGCDACQEVCPWNRKAVLHHVEEFSPNEWLMRMSREDWLSLDEEIFRERFKDSPLLRPGLEQIKRSVK